MLRSTVEPSAFNAYVMASLGRLSSRALELDGALVDAPFVALVRMYCPDVLELAGAELAAADPLPSPRARQPVRVTVSADAFDDCDGEDGSLVDGRGV